MIYLWGSVAGNAHFRIAWLSRLYWLYWHKGKGLEISDTAGGEGPHWFFRIERASNPEVERPPVLSIPLRSLMPEYQLLGDFLTDLQVETVTLITIRKLRQKTEERT